MKMDEDIRASYGQKTGSSSSVKVAAPSYMRGNSRIKRQLSINKQSSGGASTAHQSVGVAAV